MGTPAYISPEQAAGELERVGPRSDVYSLGATLYCLLTGKPPLEGDDLGAVLRAVSKGDISPPRRIEPAIDRALEAVCLKAMALRPEDRYATARELSDDVEQWMADEPVSAWREPWSRRLLRWLTRHRTGVTAAAAAMLVALAGTGAVLAVQTQANQELKRSNMDLEIANTKVLRSNSQLQEANERERQRFDLALEAIKLFHGEVSEDLLLKEKRFEALRAKLLKGAASFYGKLEGLLQGQTDPKSRRALGRAYLELGELTGQIGNPAEAVALHRKALAVRRELTERPGADSEAMLDVVRSLQALGGGLFSLGDTSGAVSSREEARTLAEKAAAAHRDADEARYLLASCLKPMFSSPAERRPEEGLEAARHALAIMQELVRRNPSVTLYQEELSSCHFVIAYTLSDMGRTAESIAEYERSVTLDQRLADAQPEVFRFQNSLAKLHNNIASGLWTLNKRVESLAAQRRAVAIWQKAADLNPAVTFLQNNVAYGLDRLANRLIVAGLPTEALEALAKSRPILQKLTDDDPTTISHPSNLAENYLYTGDALAKMGMLREAQNAYAKAVEFLEKPVTEHPSNKALQPFLVESQLNFGWRLWRAGQAAEAAAIFGRERVIRQRLVDEDPTKSDSRDRLGNCETNLAAALTATGRLTEARTCCDRAIAIREDLVKGHPANAAFAQSLAESWLRSGSVTAAAGDLAGAAADWRRAAALYAGNPPNGVPAIFRACCHGALAGLAGKGGSGITAAEASGQAEEAMAILRRAIAAGYNDIDLIRVEPGLDPLRSRDDFRRLMSDLTFPADPFAYRLDDDARRIPDPLHGTAPTEKP
jgi:serine/threonine-protein kinase